MAVMEVISSYYYAQFYSRVKYGIVFWGNSSHILRVFRVQKRIIRTIAGVSRASTCRSFFKKFRVLTVPSLYIFEVLMFVRNNFAKFSQNKQFHDYSTRRRSDLIYPIHSLTAVESNVYYVGVKLYNGLPLTIREISEPQLFKSKLWNFLVDRVFYSLEEYHAYSRELWRVFFFFFFPYMCIFNINIVVKNLVSIRYYM